MSNPLVTVLCAWAICCAILGDSYWINPPLIAAAAVAIYSNFQWSKVFKTVAKLMATRK